MKLIDRKHIKIANLSTEELFFIQLWYGMVHHNSLDSHRVRSMDSLSILHELQDLIQKKSQGFAHIDTDIAHSANEASLMLKKDSVLAAHFLATKQPVESLLPDIIKTTSQKQGISPIFTYLLKDLVLDLETSYKTAILQELEHALFITKDTESIYRYTMSLLSRLVDEGLALESLFSMVRDIFIHNRSSKEHTFADDFAFLKQVISREDSEYEIILRLTRFRKADVEVTNQQIASITFEQEFSLPPNPQFNDFLKPMGKPVFAKVKVKAPDDRSAGVRALDLLEGVLDLVRFDLEQEPILVHSKFVSIRQDNNGSNPPQIYSLPNQIPNPVKKLQKGEFRTFAATITNLFKTDELDQESRSRIRSAFRFYRLGRDSRQLENKFTNWWTALEYLARTGETGSIIDSVEKRLLPSLCLTYLIKHLEDLKETLVELRVNPPQSVAADMKTVSTKDLFLILRDNTQYADLQGQLVDQPLLLFRMNYLRNQTKDAASINTFINRHKTNLIWHLRRLYRVRCDIVHSASTNENLNLLCGNLEYYLKSLLSLVLGELNQSSSINTLKELFERTTYTYDQMEKELKAAKETQLLWTFEHFVF
jgi:hypothetical protein